MPAKVFIPNKGGHDHSQAERFGELVYVTEGFINKWDTGEMYRAWADKLEDSDSGDYILMTSLTSLCSVGSACFAFKHGSLNILLYKDGDYIERKLLLKQLIEGVQEDG